MKAVVPVNVTAIRVNANDNSNIVSQFKGRTARFERIPYGSDATVPSTGDQMVQRLEKLSSPAFPLGVGVHLHWELPDAFRRGVQPPEGGDVVFPHAPNRWLVIRYLSLYDPASQTYGAPAAKAFIVESDFIGESLIEESYPSTPPIIRPAVSVPLPAKPSYGEQPYRYMGRVLPYEKWNPASEDASDFLPSYAGEDEKPLYLTSIGFVGPGFSAYYPECCSVFGFWDHFADVPAVYNALNGPTLPPIQFKASYQVIGWVNESGQDLLSSFAGDATASYNRYVGQCKQQSVAVSRTPAAEFVSLAKRRLHWSFRESGIAYTLNADQTLASIAAPQSTLCAGSIQEIVWNMLANTGTTYFLNNPAVPATQGPSGVWTDSVRLAIGNTTQEALAALLKTEVAGGDSSPNALTNYENLLNALQLGVLADMDGGNGKIVELDEALHTKAFARAEGGWLWRVHQKVGDARSPQNADREITLPIELAEQLFLLNQAQKNYDQARAALRNMRQQLFMDWMRFVDLYITGRSESYLDADSAGSFLVVNGGDCELQRVTEAGDAAGILQYRLDPIAKSIIGLERPSNEASLAYAVWQQFQAMAQALRQFGNWELEAVPAPGFNLPTDPVLLMEGARMEPGRRNGPDSEIPARLTTELATTLGVQSGGSSFSVAGSAIAGLPSIRTGTPHQAEVQALVAEAALLIPSLAAAVGASLRAQGGANNPASANPGAFVTSLQTAQGGLSALAGGPGSGLFAAVRQPGYVPSANPSQPVTTPLGIGFTFTNAAGNGWAPHPIGWSAQTSLPEFAATRFDPYLPVFLVWNLRLWPLTRNQGRSYDGSNITSYFDLNAEAVDYQYKMTPSGPVAFTSPTSYADYTGSVALSDKSAYSLTAQISSYTENYPTNSVGPALRNAQSVYGSRKILSQALSGFNVEQTLRAFVPRMAVIDLVAGRRDVITKRIAEAAGQTPGDNWYDFGFNTQSPIATGLLAQQNFGPLRSGFLEVLGLEIVDVFGQRMKLSTPTLNPDNSLATIAPASMRPAPTDQANQSKVFLPPRLLAPARVWFQWLSATHDNKVGGVSTDFVEMNGHPATSPVCGWALPNHLDNSLFFYDAAGAAIGSFGVEHGVLVYRTRAGNLANPSDDLAQDIGAPDSPSVNPHLARFLWHVAGRNAGFLNDLMESIQNSDLYINPANYAQDANLAVFIGPPLALTRAVLSLETSGGLLPLSQADSDPNGNDPFPQDVNNQRFGYRERQPFSSANLGGVQFPARLGSVPNLDDGLVGYMLESAGADPYGTFYSSTAPLGHTNGVSRPDPTTIQLTLNANPKVLTMLVDPRAGVHATTGVLAVSELKIPPDQYSDAMRKLAMTFFTHPVLARSQGLTVPLPREPGYSWSWVTPGVAQTTDLQPNAVNDFASYSYSPQSLLEGWLRLLPTPPELKR